MRYTSSRFNVVGARKVIKPNSNISDDELVGKVLKIWYNGMWNENEYYELGNISENWIEWTTVITRPWGVKRLPMKEQEIALIKQQIKKGSWVLF